MPGTDGLLFNSDIKNADDNFSIAAQESPSQINWKLMMSCRSNN